MKDTDLRLNGTIEDISPGPTFHVKLDDFDKVVTCKMSGKLRTHNIRLARMDKVEVELSPYDLTRGRIVWRHKK